MCIQADTTSVFSKYFDTSILRNKIYFDTVSIDSYALSVDDQEKNGGGKKNLFDIVKNNERYSKCTVDLIKQVSREFSIAKQYTHVFDNYTSIYNQNKLSIENMSDISNATTTLESIKESIHEYKSQKK